MRKKRGALLNYTTAIPVEKTIGEIEILLARHRADAILKDYDGAGNVIAVSFQITLKGKNLPFRLPMKVEAVAQILNNQIDEGKVPRKFRNDLDQARRVGWRIIRSWLEAQMAIVETEMVKIQEVFLPYIYDFKKQQTFYQKLEDKQFENLLEDKRTIKK